MRRANTAVDGTIVDLFAFFVHPEAAVLLNSSNHSRIKMLGLSQIYLSILYIVILLAVMGKPHFLFPATGFVTFAPVSMRQRRLPVITSIKISTQGRNENGSLCAKDDSSYLQIWVEQAEEGFVDQDENLEQGEVCLRAVKAWASTPSSSSSSLSELKDVEDGPRFLGAAALVQRPRPPFSNSNSNTGRDNYNCRPVLPVSDAWIADSILDSGGPNLQKLGAVLLIDDLFLYHLRHCHTAGVDRIAALQSFVVQCNDSSDFTCAAYQACLDRGFAPMPTMLQSQATIYDARAYYDWSNEQAQHHDLDASSLVFDLEVGRKRYQALAIELNTQTEAENRPTENQNLTRIAMEILQLLPDPQTVKQSSINGTDVCRSLNIEDIGRQS